MRSPIRYLLIMALLLTGLGKSYSQGDRCSSIQPFCAGGSRLIFPNSNAPNNDIPNAEVGPDYGCLLTQPYPAWYFLKVGEAGSLEFDIIQSQNPDGSGLRIDVDFIVWGPFDSDDEYCGAASLTTQNIVDCSYDVDAIERMSIPNASANDVYIVLITNYDESPGYISLQQINAGSGGSTDCSIVGSALGPDRQICGVSSVELDATNSQASEYSWFIFNEVTNTYELIPNETGPRLTVTKTGTYQVTVKSNFFGTEESDQVLIEFFESPVANSPSPIIGCVSGEITIFDLNKAIQDLIGLQAGAFNVKFFENEADYQNSSPIVDPGNFTSNALSVFAVVINVATGCESQLVKIVLERAAMPYIEFNDITPVCIDLNGNLVADISLGQDLGSEFSYEWNIPNDPDGDGLQNPILILDKLPSQRNIILTVRNKDSRCTSIFSTEIRAFSPPGSVNVEISGNDFEDGGYRINAIVTGTIGDEGIYEYSLNNGSWQQNSTFVGISGGTHQITAREINGCGSATSAPFRLIGYPRFFTPNNDGYNDTWNIITGPEISVLKVLIFDRYGKLLKQFNPEAGGWDGTFNNQPMPADDYWFVIDYRDALGDGVQQFKANFTLKR